MAINYNQLPQAIKDIYTAEDWKGMSPDQQKKASKLFSTTRDRFAKIKSKAKETYSQYRRNEADFGQSEVGDVAANITTPLMGGIDGVIDNLTFLTKNAKVAEEESRKLRATLGSIADADTRKAIAEVTRELNLKLASTKMGKEAFDKLNQSLKGFQYMSKMTTEEGGKFSAAMAEQAAMLNKLGMGYAAFTQTADLAIYSLGLNEKEVRKFNLSIKDLSDDLGMLPDQVAQNLRAVSQNLMYDTATIKEQFVKLQVLSQKTGIDVGTIADRFGSGMDTIGGASSAAANINALLGTNQFSATELLGMEEGDRAEAIRAAVMSNKDVMGDIKAGGAAGKFAMISVAEALGMGRDEARRFITTGKKDSVKSKLGDEITKRTGVDSKPGEDFSNAMISFKSGTDNLATAMDQLKEAVLQAQDPSKIDVSLIRSREVALRRSLEPGPSAVGDQRAIYQQMGTFMGMGFQPGATNISQMTSIMKMSEQERGNIDRITRAYRTGALSDRQKASYERLIGDLSNPELQGAARESLISELEQMAQQSEASMQRKESRTFLSPAVNSLINAISGKSEVMGQYARGFASDTFLNVDPNNPKQVAEANKTLETELKALQKEVGDGSKTKTMGIDKHDMSGIEKPEDLDTFRDQQAAAIEKADTSGSQIKKFMGKDFDRIKQLSSTIDERTAAEQKKIDRENNEIERGTTFDEGSAGPTPFILQLDSNATRDLLEGRAVNVLGQATGRPARRKK